MASAAKKASRTTNEGAVGTYIHAGGKIGVLIELNCESDFVARTEDFQELLRDIAMHIAATDPRFVGREEVPQSDLDREKEVFLAQPAMKGKPEAVISKILEGKMSKFYEEVCLLDQPFIKEASQTIAAAHRRQGRQARRKHQRPPLRPLQGRSRRTGPSPRTKPGTEEPTGLSRPWRRKKRIAWHCLRESFVAEIGGTASPEDCATALAAADLKDPSAPHLGLQDRARAL